MVIDKAEKSERDERIVRVIELVRLMAGGEGARIVRGPAEGRARQFAIVGAAFLSAILHPPLKPQDRSRFVIVKLLPLETGRGTAGRADRARAAQARAQKLAPAFRARAIGGWTRFVDTAAVWRAGMIEDGVETRAADTYAAVLAGRDLLCRDDLPGMSEIESEIAALSDRLVRSSDRRGDGEGEQCLIQLYSSQVESWSAGERKTVGELLAKAREPGAARNEINRKLGRAGLRLDFTGGAPVLLVARRQGDRHAGLHAEERGHLTLGRKIGSSSRAACTEGKHGTFRCDLRSRDRGRRSFVVITAHPVRAGIELTSRPAQYSERPL